MRTKLTAWYDKANDRPLYGIKVHVNGIWVDLAQNGKALLYETRQECEAKRKEVRRWQYDPSLSTIVAEIVTEPAEITLGQC